MLQILIGISGSGKSTYVRSKNKRHFTIVCPDDIRLNLTGDVSDQTRNKEVWKIAYETLEISLGMGEDVIFDSTACNIETIKQLVEFAEKYHTEFCFKLFYSIPEVSNKRIQTDIKKGINRANVPYEVLIKQYSGFKNVESYLLEKYSNLIVF